MLHSQVFSLSIWDKAQTQSIALQMLYVRLVCSTSRRESGEGNPSENSTKNIMLSIVSSPKWSILFHSFVLINWMAHKIWNKFNWRTWKNEFRNLYRYRYIVYSIYVYSQDLCKYLELMFCICFFFGRCL